jgi:hypothetical protein
MYVRGTYRKEELKMFQYISQVLSLPSVFGKWNGRNSRVYQTSNRLISDWLKYGKDALMNSATLKQIAQYDRVLLETLLAKGVCFYYQTFEVSVQRVNANSIAFTAVNLKTGDESDYTFSQKSMKELVTDRITNHDLLDVIQAVYERIKD